ncbi:MAG: hypothetical protein ACYTF1_19700 [Planctomycetota bacterium]|jgi:hypothetical protein
MLPNATITKWFPSVSAINGSSSVKQENKSGNPFRFLWKHTTDDSVKRVCERHSYKHEVLMLNGTSNNDAPKPIPAECTNISDSGLYAIVPFGYGVALKQRYNFQLTINRPGPEQGPRDLISQRGEIMRVELLFGEDGYADHVGIGVRLFGPRTGTLPIPSQL